MLDQLLIGVKRTILDPNLSIFSIEFDSGWVLKARRSKAHGTRRDEKHKHEIDNLYSRRNVDQRQKMGPGRMLEWLKNKAS